MIYSDSTSKLHSSYVITCWPQLCVWVLHLLVGTLADPVEVGI